MPVCSAFKCNARTGSSKDNDKVTFHRFPLKQPERLKIWIRITQKDDWTPTPNSVLCSRHFKEDCFDRTGQTTRIRAGAVPTIVLFPRYTKKSQLLEIQECDKKEDKKFTRRRRGRCGKRGHPKTAGLKIKQTSRKDLPSRQNKSNDTPLPDPNPNKNVIDNISHEEPQTVQEALAVVASQPVTTVTTMEYQPKVLTYFSYVPRVEPKPLLPVDHPYAVTESPVKLKQRCNDITDKLEECRKKLKMEQQKVRRWHRDVGRLKNALRSLRKETATTSSCMEMVEENFSGVPKELVKRMLGEKRASLEYAEELKAFAFKLRLLSPKAYNYVRSSFKQALPHPRVMRLWQAHGKIGGDADENADEDDGLTETSAEEEGERSKDLQIKKGPSPLRARTAVQQCQYARLRVKAEEGDSFAEWVEIHKGMVVYVCFFKGATEKLISKMVKALLNVKVFEVGSGKQASVLELPGSILVVPQDTLGGQARWRSMQYPNNIDSLKGLQLYGSFVTQLESHVISSSKCAEAGVVVRCGVYGEQQALVLDSDGVSTHLIEF
ncbi:hypothetical protein JZ751_002744 [Albula glossodonta]|uniref:D-aminoacyl-tRNA deacylase n=1 Tax=Albula glossodonta TaxID=121402 RepID=A0A8T2NJ02_9TELE|nr:hypothetical protein JZ751_002744 [Albula glossodonta]